MSERRLDESLAAAFAFGAQAHILLGLVEASNVRMNLEDGRWPAAVTLAVGLLLALSFQGFLSRWLSRFRAADAVRDAFAIQSLAFFLAIMTAEAFFLHVGMLVWIVAVSAWILTSSRWLLLAPDATTRWNRASLQVLGAGFGAGAAKFLAQVQDDPELTPYVFLCVSLFVTWRLHVLARANEAPASRPSMLRWSDYARDPRLLANFSFCLCLGACLGVVFSRSLPFGATVQGAAIALLASRPFRARLGVGPTLRYLLYAAALLVGADHAFFDPPLLFPYVLGAAAAGIHVALHAGLYEPRSMHSLLDRQTTFNQGVLCGLLLASFLDWFEVAPGQGLLALAFLLFFVPYFASFLPDDEAPVTR